MDSGFTNYNKCLRVPTGTRHQLHDNCWYFVFEKLDNKSDRNAFGLTCHNFLDIERSTRKHLRPKHYGKSSAAINSFILNMLNRSFIQLESLSLHGCVDLSDSSLTSLLEYGSKMRSLNLSYCFRVTDKGLSYVASGCSALSSICLFRCSGISDYGLLTLTRTCKSLKRVDISWCLKITDLGISYLNQNCLQLDTLWISGCTEILVENFLGFSPTLARLDASEAKLDSKAVAAALSGGGLRYLTISSNWGLELGPVSLEGLATNIEFLDLEKCSLVDNDAIEKISKGCPLLQEWNLSSCSKITILGWESIGLHCQNLEILHVNHCGGLYLKGLLALGNGCKHLSVLYMNNFNGNEQSWIDAFKTGRPDVQIRKEESYRRFLTIEGCFW